MPNNPNKNGLDRLKEKWDEEPAQLLLIGAAVVASVAKLVDALSSARGRHAYAKDVNRRVKKSKKQ